MQYADLQYLGKLEVTDLPFGKGARFVGAYVRTDRYDEETEKSWFSYRPVDMGLEREFCNGEQVNVTRELWETRGDHKIILFDIVGVFDKVVEVAEYELIEDPTPWVREREHLRHYYAFALRRRKRYNREEFQKEFPDLPLSSSTMYAASPNNSSGRD